MKLFKLLLVVSFGLLVNTLLAMESSSPVDEDILTAREEEILMRGMRMVRRPTRAESAAFQAAEVQRPAQELLVFGSASSDDCPGEAGEEEKRTQL